MRAVHELSISRLHYPVTALGFGRRLGVWVQGCQIGCVNCVSRDTWEQQPPTWSIDAVIEAAKALAADGEIDGVTITGGEPTEQWPQVANLVDEFRNSFGGDRPFDVLMFTGVQPERVSSAAPGVEDRVDAVLAGPYIERNAIDAPLRATSNQQLITYSHLGETRYNDLSEMSRNHIQLVVDEVGVHLIGIPRPGDMTRLTEDLADQGIALIDTSWSPRKG